MIMQYGPFRLNVDADKTREFYRSMPYLRESCSCAGCRNYEAAVLVFPEKVRCFFHSLGIDIRKPTEVYVNQTNKDGTLFYGGFYHLCGSLLAECSVWKNGLEESDSEYLQREQEWTYAVSKMFRVSFRMDCDLLEAGFPRTALQLELEADIPWVLTEKNPYQTG